MLFIVFISVSSNADCYGKLLNDFSVESNTFQIYDEEGTEAFYQNPEFVSVVTIKKLESKLTCEEGAIKIKSVSCRQLAPKIALSLSCYVEAQSGYFFVSTDLLGNFNVIFNRFD